MHYDEYAGPVISHTNKLWRSCICFTLPLLDLCGTRDVRIMKARPRPHPPEMRQNRERGHVHMTSALRGEGISENETNPRQYACDLYTQFRPVSVEVGGGKLRLSVDSTLERNFPLPTSTLTGQNGGL